MKSFYAGLKQMGLRLKCDVIYSQIIESVYSAIRIVYKPDLVSLTFLMQ